MLLGRVAAANISKSSRQLKWIQISTNCVCSLNLNQSYFNYQKLVFFNHLNVFNPFQSSFRSYCTPGPSSSISVPEYEVICNETLESLTDYFDVIVEDNTQLVNTDVTYGDGVLTVNFGEPHGTYVINRQSPNKQIWLSSPTSGPKRYDYDPSSKSWIYRHDNKSVHDLLQEEIGNIVQSKVDFHSNCSHSGKSP